MSNEAPTDALRLVPNMPTVELTDDMLFKIETGETVTYGELKRRLAAAPASPLPEGGGQCSGISGELSGWQAISTAPKDGTRVLIGRWIDYAPAWREWAVSVAYYESGRVGPMDSFHRQGWTETFAERGATHWMPLPAAPTGEK